jgi:hypothetical protein
MNALINPLNWKHRLRDLTLVLQRSVEIATRASQSTDKAYGFLS